MADKSISDLPAASTIYDDDLFLLEQSGEAKNLRGALYKAYLRGFVDAASAASEEAAAALAGVRDAINNIPEGAATPIVNDLTTGGTSMALSAEMGKVLGQRPNPNLLDNWYFGNPVNQRGITTSANNAYGIDRWLTFGGTHTVGDGYVEISQNGIMTQYMENPSRFNGKQLNFSVLIADGELFTGFATATNLGSIYFFQDPDMVAYRTSAGLIQFYPTTKAAKIIAVKLELGTQQTLAHRDANGNWVLNEIPDYNEQLLRCCMSTANSSDAYANNKQTAAAVNAVPLDGSKAMTGNLKIQKTTEPTFVLQNTGAGRLGWFVVRDTDNTLAIANRADSNNRNNLILSPETGAVANLLRLYNVVDGAGSIYNILHTGNKPSGSYTGNGSATARTIATGGIGETVFIYGAYGIAVVTRRGSITIDKNGNVSYLAAAEAAFYNGEINIATANSALNYNGMSYYYYVP